MTLAIRPLVYYRLRLSSFSFEWLPLDIPGLRRLQWPFACLENLQGLDKI